MALTELIEALQIFAKYGNPVSPTHCEHDELWVMIDPDIVSDEDKKILDDKGFFASSEGNFLSYRYGSA